VLLGLAVALGSGGATVTSTVADGAGGLVGAGVSVAGPVGTEVSVAAVVGSWVAVVKLVGTEVSPSVEAEVGAVVEAAVGAAWVSVGVGLVRVGLPRGLVGWGVPPAFGQRLVPSDASAECLAPSGPTSVQRMTWSSVKIVSNTSLAMPGLKSTGWFPFFEPGDTLLFAPIGMVTVALVSLR
jgi:hypothetical protein